MLEEFTVKMRYQGADVTAEVVAETEQEAVAAGRHYFPGAAFRGFGPRANRPSRAKHDKDALEYFGEDGLQIDNPQEPVELLTDAKDVIAAASRLENAMTILGAKPEQADRR